MSYTTKEELIAKANELLEAAAKLPDTTYPMYFKYIITGKIVKFTGLRSGEVVKEDKYHAKGFSNSSWMPHTNNELWLQLTEYVEEPEFNYPMFFKCKKTGVVVKFEDITIGTVVDKGKSSYDVNSCISIWIPHTDTEIWQQIPHMEHNGEYFYDKQPVWAWNNYLSDGLLTFIDAKNKCVFPFNEYRFYTNYKSDILEVIKELQLGLEN